MRTNQSSGSYWLRRHAVEDAARPEMPHGIGSKHSACNRGRHNNLVYISNRNNTGQVFVAELDQYNPKAAPYRLVINGIITFGVKMIPRMVS